MHTYKKSTISNNLTNQLIVILVNEERLDILYLTNVVNFVENRFLGR